MKKIWNMCVNIYNFFCDMSDDHVGIYAAQASFFIFLSAFPFFLLLLNALAHTALDESYVIYLINTYIPHSLNPILIQLVNELYTHASGALLSITAILAVWSASKGFLAVMFGLYEIFNIHQKRNYIILRLISMIYTIFFIFVIVLSMTFIVFGNKLLKLAFSYIPGLQDIHFSLNLIRYGFFFLIMVLFFALLFRIINFKLTTFHIVLPGAVVCALGWSIFSYAFSVYIDNFFNMSYMYGSFTGVVLLMMWFYFCIYILFIGAEIIRHAYPGSRKDS